MKVFFILLAGYIGLGLPVIVLHFFVYFGWIYKHEEIKIGFYCVCFTIFFLILYPIFAFVIISIWPVLFLIDLTVFILRRRRE